MQYLIPAPLQWRIRYPCNTSVSVCRVLRRTISSRWDTRFELMDWAQQFSPARSCNNSRFLHQAGQRNLESVLNYRDRNKESLLPPVPVAGDHRIRSGLVCGEAGVMQTGAAKARPPGDFHSGCFDVSHSLSSPMLHAPARCQSTDEENHLGKSASATSISLPGVLFPAESPCTQSHRGNGLPIHLRGTTLTRQLLPA